LILPPVIFGHIYSWFDITYYLGIAAFVICFLFYALRHPHFKIDLTFIGVTILFYAVRTFTRPVWLMLENHFKGSYSLYDHSLHDAMWHVDGSDRWYFCTLLLIIFLNYLARRRGAVSTNLLYGADLVLISVSITLPIARLGCFLSGHGCYGSPTDMPWGCIFRYGDPSIVPVHPIPLYDLLLNLGIFIFLNLQRWYLRYPGRSALVMLTIVSVHNIITGPLRGKAAVFVYGGITLTQILYSVVLILCISLYFGLKNRQLQGAINN
jgi:prolipoprotein diacylglyceryltransferase